MEKNSRIRFLRFCQRILLYAYPPPFRRSFGEPIEEAFSSLAETKYRESGLGGLAWFLARVLVDTVRSALGERRSSWRERRAWKRSPEDRMRRGKTRMPASIAHDLRFGLRSLMRRPLFTFSIIATLAFGIGANTALFSVINSVLLQELPFKNADRLAFITLRTEGGSGPRSLSPIFYREFSALDGVFEETAVWFDRNYNLTGDGEPLRLQAARVSGNFFSLLGVDMALGRGFLPEEDDPGADKVVVLSHGLWQGRFGGDTSILEKQLSLDGQPVQVVGVAPADFELPLEAQLWAPLSLAPLWYAEDRRGFEFLRGLGLRLPGRDAVQAQQLLSENIRHNSPHRYDRGTRARVVPLQDLLVGDRSTALFLLQVAVGFVLLIAVANVANLLLARSESRRREVAVRLALGSKRVGLIRMMLAESFLLGVAGAALGLLIARAGLGALSGLNPIPFIHPRIDSVVIFFALAVTALVCVLFTLGPAWRVLRSGLEAAFRESGPSTSLDRRSGRIGNLLVAAEVALAFVLLIGAGIALQSFQRLLAVDPGFRTEGVVSLRLELPGARYPVARRGVFLDSLKQRVEALPGVQSAGWSSSLPLSGMISTGSYHPEDKKPREGEQAPNADLRNISPGYLSTLGIPLLEGRDFDDRDRGDAPRVIIVDRTLARRHWPDGIALGKRVTLAFLGKPQPATVIGVVGEIKERSLASEASATLYMPLRQSAPRAASLAVRTQRDPGEIFAALRREVQAMDAALPVFDVRTMEQQLSGSLAAPRRVLWLLGVFGAVALLLAMAGVYGVTAYNVSRRRREISIRKALGASRGQILAHLLRQALVLWLLGSGVGVAAALALRGAASSLAFGISPGDPVTLIGIAAAMGIVTVLAALIPSRRAAGVDSATVLRDG